MKRFLVVMAGMMAVSLWTFAATAPTAPKEIKTSKGTVTFDHKAHEAAGAKCADCHDHKEAAATKAAEGKACETCHKAADAKVKLYAAIHGADSRCKKCHDGATKAANGKVGPKLTDCKSCHKA